MFYADGHAENSSVYCEWSKNVDRMFVCVTDALSARYVRDWIKSTFMFIQETH